MDKTKILGKTSLLRRACAKVHIDVFRGLLGWGHRGSHEIVYVRDSHQVSSVFSMANRPKRKDLEATRHGENAKKMQNVPLAPEKEGSAEIPQSENAENAQEADTQAQKIRLTGLR